MMDIFLEMGKNILTNPISNVSNLLSSILSIKKLLENKLKSGFQKNPQDREFYMDLEKQLQDYTSQLQEINPFVENLKALQEDLLQNKSLELRLPDYVRFLLLYNYIESWINEISRKILRLLLNELGHRIDNA